MFDAKRSHMSASQALDRFMVLDLSRVRSGPTAARQLADWGADVISVETPAALQEGDSIGGPRQESDFQNLHRNKRSISLNSKHADGVGILKRLAQNADVVIENFRPDVKDRLGIGYDDLSAINPRLVYASISGFGQDGPYRDRPGFDQIAQGMGGLMSITGEPGRGPLRAGIPVADLCAGIFCAYGIVVALLERERSNKGQWLQTPLLQAQAFMLDFQAARWLMAGDLVGPEGNNHPTMAPTGAFRTRDGHVNIAVVGHKIWERFLRALGKPAWGADPKFATNELRRAHREELHRCIEDALVRETSETWVKRLNDLGVPCGPIYSIDELFRDPQMQQLNMVQSLPDQSGKQRQYLSQPIHMTRTPSRIVQHPAELGEHTEPVLEAIGYSGDQIADLRSRGII